MREALLALFLSSSEVLTRAQLATIFADDREYAGWEAALDILMATGDGPMHLVEVAGGYRLQIRPRYNALLARLHVEPPRLLSKASLETLAVIAYQQPVTRPEIEHWRGVAVGGAIMQQLQDKGWISVVGHRETPGRPALWATTTEFLQHFSLFSLADLPEVDAIK
ncbi:MAG: SMC-Scp complex subunit ScpB [Acidithiobacillus sp.]